MRLLHMRRTTCLLFPVVLFTCLSVFLQFRFHATDKLAMEGQARLLRKVWHEARQEATETATAMEDSNSKPEKKKVVQDEKAKAPPTVPATVVAKNEVVKKGDTAIVGSKVAISDIAARTAINTQRMAKPFVVTKKVVVKKEVDRVAPPSESHAITKKKKEDTHIASIDTPVESVPANSSYAYAWVMGAVHEDRPAYKGFLYDVLISAHLLRKLGSTADLWLWIQMSPDSALDSLPPKDIRLLEALKVHVQPLPKPTAESFADLVYHKFRTLQMTQYRRVMFLDADIIPLVNLDYIFQLSDPLDKTLPTRLRPNLITASRGEPCNTGLFMVEPTPNAYQTLQEVISKQHESARNLPYPHFDRDNGWGHNFWKAGDQWEGIHLRDKPKDTKRWKFHAAHSDQGLMYHYAKYVTQDVSIAIGGNIQNWLPNATSGGQPYLNSSEPVLQPFSPPPLAYQERCDEQPEGHILCSPPYRDFAHFMGGTKPWQQGVKTPAMRLSNTKKKNAPHKLWFQELSELNQKYNMGLNIQEWNDQHKDLMGESPLGYIAKYSDSKVISEKRQPSVEPTAANKTRVSS